MMEENFDFAKEVKKHYKHVEIKTKLLKDIYNSNGKNGCSTEETRKKGIYALFYQGELKKIGKATYKTGIFHRMVQYYNLNKKGGLSQINIQNRDEIEVLYFNLPKNECWYAERRLQVIAHDCGEKMPWENTSRN